MITQNIKSKFSKELVHRVLLVEDNPTIQAVHKVMLLELGCQVDVVSSGEEALLFLDKEYDCVFLDISLPGINGIELAGHFRAHDRHENTRLVAVTTKDDRNTEIACIRAGIEQVVVKPAQLDDFRALLLQVA